jgi:hypothetical protein
MAFVDDTFTDTDATLLTAHTGETGATWTMHPAGSSSSPVINSNKVNDSAISNNIPYASGTPAGVEYSIDAIVVWATGASCTGVCGRMDTVANTFYMIRNTNSTTWELFKRVAGTFTSLGTATTSSVSGTTQTLTLEITDATKRMLVGGSQVISSTDNVITAAGRVGLRGNGSSSTVGGAVDRITATDIGGGAAAVQQLFALMGVGS